ncbi:MAG: aminopeptidase, partial [Lachnospiraceae bacterium]|nr:aminopeptidase [Lachnospiraceae bacterium]
GKLLCALYTELRGDIAYAFEERLLYLTISFELFIEIYNILEDVNYNIEEVKSALYYYFFDYSDIMTEDRTRSLLDPDMSFAKDIIMESDLSDLSYLYYFGEYISTNEYETARYLNTLPQEEVENMARTFTEGYRKGFEAYKIDLSVKKTVNIRYTLGFERIVREAVKQFEDMGLKSCIYRAGVSIATRSQHGKIGYYGASPNKQYDYDHRMDLALIFDKAYADRRLGEIRHTYENFKEEAAAYAGPAVMEIFGEKPFTPKTNKYAASFTEKQEKQHTEYVSASSLITNEYIPGDKVSFTIIAYPVPEIGNDYKEIFKDTIKVNTLESDTYEVIQSKIIDALDKGEFVNVTGRGDNHTDINIALTPIDNPDKETKFENCLADVNIPLGEVFTSPKLKGTNGTLHVTEVYLNGLKYDNLELVFKDGVVSEYTCTNFSTEEENRRYIKENVLFNHKTLPMGEFAIGTNTTAYAMGLKYNISHLLPILIAEKTGPHFAIGDTCFSHEEELRTYNPDGKEMKAKENDFSLLRNTDTSHAYFNCHTDITIPYHELGDITVHCEDGSEIKIIENGRFVLEGTQELNEVL